MVLFPRPATRRYVAGPRVGRHTLLLRSSGLIFYLVMTAEPIAALARTAAARAVMLDAREAPQREAAREKKKRTTAALRRRKLD
jgi:hypothetical protein